MNGFRTATRTAEALKALGFREVITLSQVVQTACIIGESINLHFYKDLS